MGRRMWGALIAFGALAPAVTTVALSGTAPALSEASPRHAPMQGGVPTPSERPGRAQGVPTALTSTNWSGYADTGATFQTVSGTWTQPAATCPSSTHQFSSFWVGIDGFNDDSVEQLGTDSDCQGKLKPAYYGWFEMFPGPSETLPHGHAVSPGDVITASVSWVKKGTFTLKMSDSGKWTFATTQSLSPAPPRSSAEWIAEAPSECRARCQVLPLADFSSVSFRNATVDGNPVSSGADDVLTMVNGHKTVKATPSALSAGGTAFNVTWSHS